MTGDFSQFQDTTDVFPCQSIFLYACESWTLTAELQKRIQAMEMRCYHKILCVSLEDHVTNEEVRAKIQQEIGPHEELLTIVKRRKLQWYGHVSRSSGLSKTILQGTVKEGKADRRRGGKTTSGNDRPGVRQVQGGSGEQGTMEETGCEIICGVQTTLAVKGQMMMMTEIEVRGKKTTTKNTRSSNVMLCNRGKKSCDSEVLQVFFGMVKFVDYGL